MTGARQQARLLAISANKKAAMGSQFTTVFLTQF